MNAVEKGKWQVRGFGVVIRGVLHIIAKSSKECRQFHIGTNTGCLIGKISRQP